MTQSLIHLSYLDLLLATGLVLVAGAVSVAMRLGLEKSLAIASLRTVVQLLLLGYVLKFVFALEGGAAMVAVVGVMVVAAARAAVKRPKHTFSGITWRAVVTLVLSGILTTYVVTGVVVKVSPWYHPQYMIPILGMILGNGLTGLSISLDYLLQAFSEHRQLVEMELSLGATKWEAARTPIREAVRRGMIPLINSMMVVGVVSLPGMMTGQILAGADPLESVKYQIVVMFMLAAATSTSCILICWLVYKRLFNSRHQLIEGVLTKRS